MLSAVLLSLVAQSDQAPKALAWNNFDSVKAYVQPSARDLNFQKVDWHDRLYEGLVQAQKEDKPLVLWLYFGDPRGGC